MQEVKSYGKRVVTANVHELGRVGREQIRNEAKDAPHRL
jgi:hypothetical protein